MNIANRSDNQCDNKRFKDNPYTILTITYGL